MDATQIALFKGKKIRKIIDHDEWSFSVVDVIAALTDSPNARSYWKVLKFRLKKRGVRWLQNVTN